jgi:uncharacterized protein (TIGR00369 family)
MDATTKPDAAARAAIVKLVPFSAHLGFELVRCDAAGVVVEVVLAPEHCTAGSTAHGGFLMTLADFAGAAGAMQVLPEGARSTTTIESKTNMIGAAPVGGRLRATATPLHVGRRTSVWVTRVETAAGKLISVTTQTQMVL